MTPELPRAPISETCVTALHNVALSASRGRRASSAMTASMVSAMFVPVSPSGTGKTFSRLTSSARSLSAEAAEETRVGMGASDVIEPLLTGLFADFDPLDVYVDVLDTHTCSGFEDIPDPVGKVVRDLTQVGAVFDNDIQIGSHAVTNAGTFVTQENGAALTALQVIDDWDESDRAKVNPIVGQAGIAAGAGAVGVTVPRVTLASDDPAVVDRAATIILQDTTPTGGGGANKRRYSLSLAGVG